MPPILIRTWKVQSTASGMTVTLNGQAYELGASMEAFAFDVDRVANGYNGPTATVRVKPDEPKDIDAIDDDREWAAAKREQADAEDHQQQTMTERYAPKGE